MTFPRQQRAEESASSREHIAEVLTAARTRSLALTGCVDDLELTTQHSRLMSPLVWDLAHVGSQEEIWLLRAVAGHEPMRPEIDNLYDAFEHPRADRPALPLLGPAEARRYIGTVRDMVIDVIDTMEHRGDPLTDNGFVFGMVAQHEQQHDETMLATHQLRAGAAVLTAPEPTPAPSDAARLPPEVLVPAGGFTMGTSTQPWALDNERPAHVVDLPGYWIDTVPVTNAAYLAFMAAGGYDRAEFWTPQGWDHRCRAELRAPLFWWRDGGQWLRRRFGVSEVVPPDEPVSHVCWYEADACARWAGRRLPSEAEWEKAARHDPATGRSRRYPWGDAEPTPQHANLGQRHLRPAAAGSYPAGASPLGIRQLIGDIWEWTSSEFRPYPGFVVFPYQEYSAVFFGPEYRVLRGGSFGTAEVACRGTFRNWDYPIRRQIFSGFRTARDAAPDVGEAG